MNYFMNDQGIDSWVFYRRPATSEIVHIAGKARVVKGNSEWLNKQGFVIAPFNRSKHDTIFIDEVRNIHVHTEHEILELFNDGLRWPLSKDLAEPWRNISKREYLSYIRQIIKEIGTTSLEKVVLSRVINVDDIKPYGSIGLFIELCRKYPNAFVFFFYSPGVGLWLGATPETLMLNKNTRYRIISLAGTVKWQPELTFTQLWNSKELEEQQMVTDFVKKVIDESGITGYDVKGPETLRAGNMAHLRTIFRFESEDPGLIDPLIDKLHPTPAVCGLPQDMSREVIALTEIYDRTYYTGFLGPVCNDSFSLFVNLRCLQYTKKGVQLFVGGGLTKDSQPEAEWEETEMKAQTLLSVINSKKEK